MASIQNRIGFGIDFHELVEGRDLWIGGVKIPFAKGAMGHSDADVLLHAICDALLGALSLGDIGQHFPNTDDSYKNIDSKIHSGIWQQADGSYVPSFDTSTHHFLKGSDQISGTSSASTTCSDWSSIMLTAFAFLPSLMAIRGEKDNQPDPDHRHKRAEIQ